MENRPVRKIAVERSEKPLVNLHDLVSQLLIDTKGSADGGLLAYQRRLEPGRVSARS